jgi:ornithine cyclodeaminase/alanine dehydrogenase-like protein (mu-crystallin family)
MNGTEPGDDRFLVLSDADLAGLGIAVGDIATAIEAAIVEEARGAIRAVPKSALLPGDGRYMMTTLASGDDPDMTIVKSVMVSPRNPGRGRPGIDGAILVQDSETGALRAVMQAGWITAMRTAGLSAVAARRLADPAAATIGFIGTGVQARSHLETFAAMFPLTGISVYGRGQANIDRLCDMARAMGLTARACDTPREAVETADLIVSSVTLSYDMTPFVDARWLKPGSFAAITDLALPWLPESMTAFDSIHVDDAEQEAASEKKLVAPDLVRGDLKALIAAPAATLGEARRAFVFRGLAIGDFALARLACLHAERAGAGQRIGF